MSEESYIINNQLYVIKNCINCCDEDCDNYGVDYELEVDEGDCFECE